MERMIQRLAIIGQGLIGSSITRAARAYGVAREITITDSNEKVRNRTVEIGLGDAKVVSTNIAAVEGADFIVLCVPVGQIAEVVQEIGGVVRKGAILTDVGSVKGSVIRDTAPYISREVHFIPAHPLAGTESSGPESGLTEMFLDRWCILTPPSGADLDAVEEVKRFWQAIGSHVEIMDPKHHDYVLAITSHIPHLIAFTIFHTALRHERITDSEVMKYSAGGFRDFTRIASSNPAMWRDIFLNNKEAILDVLLQFNADLSSLTEAIRKSDGERIFDDLSTSRLARRKVIEREHISAKPKLKPRDAKPLFRPYSSGD